MCCGDDEELGPPAVVIQMLAHHRRPRDEQGSGWGEFGHRGSTHRGSTHRGSTHRGSTLPDSFRWARFSLLRPAFDEFAGTGDWAAAVRAAVGDEVPAGLLLVSISSDRERSARGAHRRHPHRSPELRRRRTGRVATCGPGPVWSSATTCSGTCPVVLSVLRDVIEQRWWPVDHPAPPDGEASVT